MKLVIYKTTDGETAFLQSIDKEENNQKKNKPLTNGWEIQLKGTHRTKENDSETYKLMSMNLFVTLSNVLIQWLTYYVLDGTRVENLYTITSGYIINKHPERLGENQRFKVLLTLDVVLQWSINNLYSNVG